MPGVRPKATITRNPASGETIPVMESSYRDAGSDGWQWNRFMRPRAGQEAYAGPNFPNQPACTESCTLFQVRFPDSSAQ
jgi:hypothetical protein